MITELYELILNLLLSLPAKVEFLLEHQRQKENRKSTQYEIEISVVPS